MTTFLLIRHGLNDWVNHKLAGWLPGVHLNERGREQVERLARRLLNVELAAVVSSPLERAIETAAPLVVGRGLAVEACEEVGEIRCGEWTGREIAELDRGDEQWRRFNTFRGGTRPPGGELMLETQVRMVNALLRLRDRYGNARVVVVSHGDPLRAVLGYFLGAPIDLFHRVEVSPASLSIVEVNNRGARVLSINDTGHLDPG